MTKMVKRKTRWISRLKVAEGEAVDPWGHNTDLEDTKQRFNLRHITPIWGLE
jgi:hypothetical protein